MKIKIIFLLFVFMGCATIKPLDGGDKDETAPKITSYSPDSAALNVSPSEILLEFDEYIKGENLSQNVIISPTPKTIPEISVKGKVLRILFKEPLEENATYTILLNNAIKDVNEGNMMPSTKYIFSTGPVIDSLQYNGYIKNSFSAEECEDCILALYENLSDSVVLKERPQYLITTNANGRANITNLPNKMFKAVAFKDENKNLKLDNGEFVSLSDTVQFGSTDTFLIFPYNTSNLISKPKVNKKTKPFDFELTFENPLITAYQLFINNKEVYPIQSVFKDTLSIRDSSFADTLDIKLLIDTNEYKFTKILSPRSKLYPIRVTTTNYNKDTIFIQLNTIIKSIDKSLFTITIDSVSQEVNPILSDQVIKIPVYRKPDAPFTFIAKPKSINDIYNNTYLGDSIVISNDPINLPDIKLIVKNTKKEQLILQLIDSKEKILRQTIIKTDTTISINNVSPQNYKVRTIADTNHNGIWDTGDIFKKLPAEAVLISEEFEMRIDWDKELIINY